MVSNVLPLAIKLFEGVSAANLLDLLCPLAGFVFVDVDQVLGLCLDLV